MQTQDAIRQRHSCRAFLDKEVPQALIEQLLELASCAPSGANTQPWQIAVVRGEAKFNLCSAMQETFAAGQRGQMDYAYYPESWTQPFDGRRKACGAQLYQALGIERADRETRLRQWAANYGGFGAPVLMFFFIDKALSQGSWLDYGMFLQTLMLAATDLGLATCPQAALAEYPDIVREQLGYCDQWTLLCGMALGYEDTGAVVNQYRTPRAPISDFSKQIS